MQREVSATESHDQASNPVKGESYDFYTGNAEHTTRGGETISAEQKTYLGTKGVPLNFLIAFSAGVGFVLFGYDQGVYSSLLDLVPFRARFPKIDTESNAYSQASALRGATIGIYEIGCFIGAISCLMWGDVLGRRMMIWIGSVLMLIGAVIQCAATPGDGGLAMLWVGRIIGGIGNGQHTATIPVWQSECSPPHRRGMLIMIEGTLIAFGIMVSYWIDFALFWTWKLKFDGPAQDLQTSSLKAPNLNDPKVQAINYETANAMSVSWRFPIAFQIVLIIPTFLTIWLPESPRWLMLRGDEARAREALSAIEGVPQNDGSIEFHMEEIRDGLAITKGVGLRDLLRQGEGHYFHRTVLGFVIQMFQQISGINLITYYAGSLFQNQLNFSDVKSRILAACNGTEYFLASIVAIFTVERFGRRTLMLFGAIGMCATDAILAGVLSGAATNGGNGGAGSIVGAVMLFVFNTFFGIGWLGMTWLYPAECTPLSIRAAANGISTSANWLFNFLVVMVTPVMFDNIDNYTFLVFAAINFCMIPATYLIFPETAGRSLEEMDKIFAESSYVNPFDVVLRERRFPRRYDHSGKAIAPIHDDENLEPVENKPEYPGSPQINAQSA